MKQFYDLNFGLNPDDDFSNNAKSNETGLSVDLNSCNIDTVNNLDDQITPVSKEASNLLYHISQSIKTCDANTQSDTQTSFNHDTINDNLKIETFINQFKELTVKAQDLQISYCKFINVISPNSLTKVGFPDITDVDDETVWEKGTILLISNSIISGLRESKMSK